MAATISGSCSRLRWNRIERGGWNGKAWTLKGIGGSGLFDLHLMQAWDEETEASELSSLVKVRSARSAQAHAGVNKLLGLMD